MGPPGERGLLDQACTKPIHGVDQEIPRIVKKIIVFLRLFACHHSSFGMSHGHGSVENLVNNHAVCSRSIAAHMHVCCEELLFGFPVPFEFKNCSGQIIGGVGDVEFGYGKVMMLEVGLKDGGWCA